MADHHHNKLPFAIAASHNLELNGSNICLLNILSHFSEKYAIELASPVEGPLRSRFEDLGIKVTIIPFPKVGLRRDISELLQKKPNFAFVNTVICSDIMAIVGEMNIPHLWMIHEMWNLDKLDDYQKTIWKWEWPKHQTFYDAFKSVKHIVYPAIAAKECYLDLTKRADVRVIYNGLPRQWFDVDCFVKNREKYRKELSIPNDEIVFLQVGSINHRKSQMTSLQAFINLKRKHPNLKVSLLFVGARKIRQHEIEYLDKIEMQIKQEGMEQYVRILPSTFETKPYYALSDVVLMPSISEVLPLVILEAMAFSLPVIATDIDGIGEAIQNEAHGYLYQLGDLPALERKMEILSMDSDLRYQMGIKGRNKFEKFYQLDRMIREYDEVVRGICG